jgi:hypothetical protein
VRSTVYGTPEAPCASRGLMAGRGLATCEVSMSSRSGSHSDSFPSNRLDA